MVPKKKHHRIIWLSHPLNNNTPQYGGGEGINIAVDKCISKGDSCNTSHVSLSNHIGSHVDAPIHFITGGLSIDSYAPEEWIFNRPIVLDAFAQPGKIIELNDLTLPKENIESELVDMVLINTGFEKYRDTEKYWKCGPGLSPDICEYLKDIFPSIKAIGIDIISISSLLHREIGRDAHRSFLSRNIRLFEDLSLNNIHNFKKLRSVVALPLRISGGNGAPCTIIGWERLEC